MSDCLYPFVTFENYTLLLLFRNEAKGVQANAIRDSNNIPNQFKALKYLSASVLNQIGQKIDLQNGTLDNMILHKGASNWTQMENSLKSR